MAAKQTKLLTVASNGQISIGKAWAGRQIIIEEITEGELHIRAGVFVPDSQKHFHTKAANASLTEFNNWEKNKVINTTKSSDVLVQLKKRKQSRGK